jgi:hypothetical protein
VSAPTPAQPHGAQEHRRTTGDGEGGVVEAVGQAGGDRGGGEGGGGHGQEGQARFQRCVAADALEVLGHEEEEAQQRAVEQEAGGVGAGARTAGEQAQRQQRLRDAGLVDQEHRNKHETDADREQGDGVGPAGVSGVHDAEDQGADAHGGAERAGEVRAAGMTGGLGQEAREPVRMIASTMPRGLSAVGVIARSPRGAGSWPAPIGAAKAASNGIARTEEDYKALSRWRERPRGVTRDTDLVHNDDGSVDLYFGPSAAAGREANWVQMIPRRHWFSYFRFYGPLEPYFDRSWSLGDIRLLPPQRAWTCAASVRKIARWRWYMRRYFSASARAVAKPPSRLSPSADWRSMMWSPTSRRA